MKHVALAAVLLLAGCISAEERAARDYERARQQEAAQQAQNKAYTESLHSQCAAIGYQRGSEGMRQCVLQLHTSSQAHNAQMRAVILQQLLQQERENELRNMPRCPNNALGGYQRAQGACR